MDEIEGQYIGLIKLSVQGVKIIKKVFHSAQVKGKISGKEIENAYMTDFIQLIINEGYKVKSVPIDGDWIEVDVFDVIVDAERADEIFSFIYEKAGIGEGTHGFMVQSNLARATKFSLPDLPEEDS